MDGAGSRRGLLAIWPRFASFGGDFSPSKAGCQWRHRSLESWARRCFPNASPIEFAHSQQCSADGRPRLCLDGVADPCGLCGRRLGCREGGLLPKRRRALSLSLWRGQAVSSLECHHRYRPVHRFQELSSPRNIAAIAIRRPTPSGGRPRTPTPSALPGTSRTSTC